MHERIAIITDRLDMYGGRERMIVEYARALVQLGPVQVVALFPCHCDNQLQADLSTAGAEVVCLDAFPYPPKGVLDRVCLRGRRIVSQWLRDAGITAAVCMTIRTFARCCGPASRQRVRLVYAHHLDFPLVGGRLAGLKEWIARWQLQRHAHAVLALSTNACKQFLALGLRSEKVRLCPNGFDLEYYRALAEPERSAQRRAWRVEHTFPLLVMAARLDPIKNIEMALQAVAQLRERWPDIALVVLGTEGPEARGYQQRLQAQIEQMGLADRVRLAGWAENAPAAISCGDILLLTSRAEQLPTCLIEAQAVGTPCIATNVGGVADIVVDGETGLLVPPADAVALAAAIDRLAEDDELRAAFARTGQCHVRDHYTREHLARVLVPAVAGE